MLRPRRAREVLAAARGVDEARPLEFLHAVASWTRAWTPGIWHDLLIAIHCPDARHLVVECFHHPEAKAALFFALSACLCEAQIEQTPASQAINCPTN